MATITLSDVTKDYGNGVLAVESLSLDIADGEFLVLLGPSGCGKSTALRMIAGLETVTSGELYIGSDLVNDVPARDRNISMVFQSYALYPHMTVRKNIASPLRVRAVPNEAGTIARLSRAEIAERVERVAAMLGLTDYLDRKPGALSGGQRQRVALARAIVAEPVAYLMDEPLSNLDAKLRTQTRAELIELHRRTKRTVVYVTHDQVEAMTMAQRIAVMEGGRLQQLGTPQEVYERPANVFVAGFIGTPPMNFFTATVASADTLMIDGGTIVLPGHGVAEGAVVHLGIRPEHLVIADDGVALEVHTVEWLGHETLIGCSAPGRGDDTVVSADRVVFRHEGSTDLRPGDTVRFSADAANIHLFDLETGARL